MNIAAAKPISRIVSLLGLIAHSFQVRLQAQRAHSPAASPIYQIADQLHGQRTVQVTGDEIAATVTAWLAELGVESPMAEDLAQAVCAGEWPTAYSICQRLSINVSVAC